MYTYVVRCVFSRNIMDIVHAHSGRLRGNRNILTVVGVSVRPAFSCILRREVPYGDTSSNAPCSHAPSQRVEGLTSSYKRKRVVLSTEVGGMRDVTHVRTAVYRTEEGERVQKKKR